MNQGLSFQEEDEDDLIWFGRQLRPWISNIARVEKDLPCFYRLSISGGDNLEN